MSSPSCTQPARARSLHTHSTERSLWPPWPPAPALPVGASTCRGPAAVRSAHEKSQVRSSSSPPPAAEGRAGRSALPRSLQVSQRSCQRIYKPPVQNSTSPDGTALAAWLGVGNASCAHSQHAAARLRSARLAAAVGAEALGPVSGCTRRAGGLASGAERCRAAATAGDPRSAGTG